MEGDNTNECKENKDKCSRRKDVRRNKKRMYYENAYSTKSENNILDELKEYILLLVKSNMSLPTHPEEMQHLIKSQSRFEKPVLEKINEKKLSSK